MLELFLLPIAILIYLPCLNGAPIYDDQQLFRGQDWSTAALKKPVLRWLFMLSFALTVLYVKEKYRIQVLHLTSTVMHWINAMLVGCVAGYFVDPVSASMATLIFLVHPLTVPAVAPFATRSAVMATTFSLLSVMVVLSGYPVLAIPLVALAILCKEDAVATIPLILVLTAIESIVMAAVVLVLIVVILSRLPLRDIWTWMMERNGEKGMEAAGILDTLDQPAYTITAIAENIRRWPQWVIGFGMCADPVVPERSWRSWQLWTAVVVIVIATGLLFIVSPMLQLAILLVGCSPWAATWFVRLPDAVAESRAYSTVAGLALACSLLPWPLTFVLGVGWILLACRRSYQQRHPVPYWLSAWRDKTPKFRVAINIGAAFQGVNDMENARTWHLKALELNPNSGIALANMGLWHEGLSRVERHLLSESYVRTGRVDAAQADQHNQQSLKHLARALELMTAAEQACPDDPIVHKYAQMVRDSAANVGLRLETVPA